MMNRSIHILTCHCIERHEEPIIRRFYFSEESKARKYFNENSEEILRDMNRSRSRERFFVLLVEMELDTNKRLGLEKLYDIELNSEFHDKH